MGWPITHPSTIYAIRCKENGKIYIGRTYRFERRIKEHFYELRRDKKLKTQRAGRRISTDFQDDYNRYGESAFEAYVLAEYIAPEKCQETEAKWIAYYHTTEPDKGYNIRREQLKGFQVQFKSGIPPKQPL